MKTMKINELISELNGFYGESDIKVWIRGVDKAYPINDLFIDSINEDGSLNMLGCPRVATGLLVKKGIKLNGKEQFIDDVHIYPAEYFNPYDSITGRLKKTSNTYSIHWYDQSWGDDSKFKKRLTQLVHRVFGVHSLEWIKKLLKK